MRTEFNGIAFFFGQFDGCWNWTTSEAESESSFQTAADAQADAMRYVRKKNRDTLIALEIRRTAIWNGQPHCNLAALPAEKAAYRQREEAWLADMREIDRAIDAARKGAV